MPQPPEDLSRIIREMAREIARSRGRLLSPDAERRIGVIPPSYSRLPQIPVDLGKLREMIADIIELAVSPRGTIGTRDIETALEKVKCHYLWFC